ncbi:MAG: cation diffusion facilitator family transporter [Gemmatimonadota bacterium]|nr:cation diffusion facilitator family transporter [Gemmatimonadota bacterium]
MPPSLKRYAALSIAAALATIALKGGAYLLTGSVGLLSDAVESLVNLLAAIAALFALEIAARPEDDEHAYGHTKAEYFASGFEGALVLVAAGSIVVAAVGRLIDPQPIQEVGIGVAISIVASLINYGVAKVLLRAGRHHGSVALEADAQHLMTDVWTSAGVVVGLGAVAFTGWTRLDAVIAILVAGNIVRTGVLLLRRSMHGLLDSGLPEGERSAVASILGAHAIKGVEFHALRTQQAGVRRFVSFHMLVPGEWTVQRGHDLLEEVESQIRGALPNATLFTHLEPIEDPVSFQDERLERGD